MSKIEWCDKTWNPITGCAAISEGCWNCYAKKMAQRLQGRFGYDKDKPFRPTFHADKLDEPLKWKKPRTVFVCSMGDLFHKDVSGDWIIGVFDRMHQLPRHTFILLTKRPQRMYDFITGDVMSFWKARYNTELPPSNVWFGVTAENQVRADERIPILLDIPATVRFVSVEPMLGPVKIGVTGTALDWVICGAETGQGARHMELDWARDLRVQCKESGIPFFFKKSAPGIVTLDNEVIREWPT